MNAAALYRHRILALSLAAARCLARGGDARALVNEIAELSRDVTALELTSRN